MKTWIATAGLLAALGSADSARAERFEIAMGAGAHFVPLESMDALSADSAYGVVALDASMAVPELLLLDGYTAQAGISWDFGELSGTTFNRIRSSMEVDRVVATGRVRRSLVGPLRAFAQFELGLQWASLELQDAESQRSRPLTGDARAVASGIGGGFELDLSSRRSKVFRMGLRMDATYEVASSMEFEASPMSEGEDQIDLPTQSAGLGSVNTSGMSLGLSITGRF